MMCHRIGRFPIGTIGFGMLRVVSLIRNPWPPQKMTTFIGDLRSSAAAWI
jgi:hypothetical protein